MTSKKLNWVYCAANVKRDPKAAQKPDPTDARVLVELFKDVLKQAVPGMVSEIAIAERRVFVEVVQVGDSALLARWTDAPPPNTIATSVTMLLSGEDDGADEQARAQLASELLPDGSEQHPTTKLLLAKLGEEPRPLAATICLTAERYDDPAFQLAASALARAFLANRG